jgi:prolipoprotein diacylglyceryltransferase
MGSVTVKGFFDFVSEDFRWVDVGLLTLFAIDSGQLLCGVVIVLGFLFRAHVN